MTLVNIRGAVTIPKGRALNWKTLFPITNQRYFLADFATRMRKYASFRSMDIVHSPCLKAAMMEDVASTLKLDGFRFWFSAERSITSM